MTEGIVAPIRGVAQPKLPSAVVAPALEGRVVLRRESTEDHRLRIGSWGESFTQGLQGALR